MKSSAGMLLIFKECAYLIIDCTVMEQENLTEQINSLMKKHNAKSLAVESMDMTLSRMSFLEKKFPDIEFIKSDELSNNIYDMRTIKSTEEIEKIHKAQKIAEKAFDEILGFIRPGVTEREIACLKTELRDCLLRQLLLPEQIRLCLMGYREIIR